MTARAENASPPIDPVKLDQLAEVAVRVGLGLQKGQDLVLTAPIAALPLVRRITEHAYKAGAGIVTALYSDDETTLMRYRYGPDLSFDRAEGWLYDGMAKAFSNGAARLAVRGDNPMLLSGEDPAKVAPRQPRQFDCLPSGARENHRIRHQLEHSRLSDARLGKAGVSKRR